MEDKWSDLKTFTEKGVRKKNEPFISINKQGLFYFNSSFILQMDELNNHVIVSYSRKNNKIVFDFNKSKTDDYCFKLTENSYNSKQINISKFFKINEIRLESIIGKYSPKLEKVHGNKMSWTIDLQKEMKNENS